MAEWIKMLFGVNTPGGPRNIVLDGGADPSTGERAGDIILNFGTPLISLEWLQLENCFACIEKGGGPTLTMQK